MYLYKLLSINGTEVTEHGRTIKIDEEISANDIDLASGHRRRYYSNNKQKFNISWTWLPDLAAHTVDSRDGRAFLNSLINATSSVLVGIELSPGEGYTEYNCFIDSYSESLVRRDPSSKCSYYDISLSLVEA